MISTANSNKNKVISTIAAVLLGVTSIIGLQGCGGSSDSVTVVPTQDASGLFKGTGAVNTATTLTDIRGFVHGTRFMFFDETASVLYDGQITDITGSDVTATADIYIDGLKVSSSTITGTVTSQSSMSLILTGTGFGEGTLSMTFDPLYNRGATIAKLVTIPPIAWIGDATTASVGTFIDSPDDGSFTGGVGGGGISCLYDGTKSVPDATINIYQLTLIVTDSTDCDHAGTGYTGFFAVVDGDFADDTVLFAASNGTNANFSIMTRNIP